MQEAFDRDLTESFTGLSVNETIFKLIRLGYASRAKKMQSEFKVPEKTATWLRYASSLTSPSLLCVMDVTLCMMLMN